MAARSSCCSQRGGCQKVAATSFPALLAAWLRPDGGGAAAVPHGAAAVGRQQQRAFPAARCAMAERRQRRPLQHCSRRSAPCGGRAAARRRRRCSCSSWRSNGRKAVVTRYPALLAARRWHEAASRKATALLPLLAAWRCPEGGGVFPLLLTARQLPEAGGGTLPRNPRSATAVGRRRRRCSRFSRRRPKTAAERSPRCVWRSSCGPIAESRREW